MELMMDMSNFCWGLRSFADSACWPPFYNETVPKAGKIDSFKITACAATALAIISIPLEINIDTLRFFNNH
jgi:hypothetical protein